MTSGTNVILVGLAVADISVMASYAPYAFHTFVRNPRVEHLRYSYGWTLFTLFHANFSVILHTVSIWLTVLLAVFRYNSIKCFKQPNKWLSPRRARMAVFLVYLTCPCFCIPAYFTFTIKPRESLPTNWAHEENDSVALFSLWLNQENDSDRFDNWNQSRDQLDNEYLSPSIGLVGNPTEDLNPWNVEEDTYDINNSLVPADFRKFIRTYRVTFSDVAIAHGQMLNRLNFWIYSVLTKLIPCLALTYLSVALIHQLCQANQRRRVRMRIAQPLVHLLPPLPNQGTSDTSDAEQAQITSGTCTSRLNSTAFNCETAKMYCIWRSDSDHSVSTADRITRKDDAEIWIEDKWRVKTGSACDRSTRMLICILVLFLITEFPSGLLALLSGILGEPFFHNVYHNLGEVMDLMALINNGVNFILYCSMSSKFRRTFREMFLFTNTNKKMSRGKGRLNSFCSNRASAEITNDQSRNSKNHVEKKCEKVKKTTVRKTAVITKSKKNQLRKHHDSRKRLREKRKAFQSPKMRAFK